LHVISKTVFCVLGVQDAAQACLGATPACQQYQLLLFVERHSGLMIAARPLVTVSRVLPPTFTRRYTPHTSVRQLEEEYESGSDIDDIKDSDDRKGV
jgi:hypothetical protein